MSTVLAGQDGLLIALPLNYSHPHIVKLQMPAWLALKTKSKHANLPSYCLIVMNVM